MILLLATLTLIFSKECYLPEIFHDFTNCVNGGLWYTCPNQGTCLPAEFEGMFASGHIKFGQEKENCTGNTISWRYKIENNWKINSYNLKLKNGATDKDVEISIHPLLDTKTCENAMQDEVPSNYFTLVYCFECTIPKVDLYVNGLWKCNYEHVDLERIGTVFEAEDQGGEEKLYMLEVWEPALNPLNVHYLCTLGEEREEEICFEELCKLTEVCDVPYIYQDFDNCFKEGDDRRDGSNKYHCANQGGCGKDAWFQGSNFNVNPVDSYIVSGNEYDNCDLYTQAIEFKYGFKASWTIEIFNIDIKRHTSNLVISAGTDSQTYPGIFPSNNTYFYEYYFTLRLCYHCTPIKLELFIDGMKCCEFKSKEIHKGKKNEYLFEIDPAKRQLFFLAAWNYYLSDDQIYYLYQNYKNRTNLTQLCFKDYLVPTCDGKQATHPDVCSSNGKCLATDYCYCAECFYGDNCKFFNPNCELCNGTCPSWDCYQINKDDPEVCSSNGKCISQNHCVCAECWDVEPDCSVFNLSCPLIPFCNSTKDCLPPGECLPINCTKDCSCTKIPECFGIDALNQSACSSNGKCLYTDYCHCTYGYHGEACQHLNKSLICPPEEEKICNQTIYCPCPPPTWTCCTYDKDDHEHTCNGNGYCMNQDECHCLQNGVNETDPKCELLPSGGGSCVETPECNPPHGGGCDGTCFCNQNYFGPYCNAWKCGNIHKDHKLVCNGYGLCVRFDLCDCLPGYTGSSLWKCDLWNCSGIPNNEKEVCSGHGTCKDIDYCDCDCGWKGDLCETAGFESCQFCNTTKDCPITQVCNETAGCDPCQVPFCNTTQDCPPQITCPLEPYFNCSINCTCPEGSSCPKIPECFGIYALNKSVCSSSGNCLSTDYCHCTYGYYGVECQYLNESLICSPEKEKICNQTIYCPPSPPTWTCCTNDKDDHEHTCNGNGYCMNQDECHCLQNGVNELHEKCEVLPPGGGSCRDESECHPENFGTCSNGGICICNDQNYFGPYCNAWKCGNIHKDHKHVCNGYGRCVRFDLCDCLPGYTGSSPWKCDLWNCYGIPNNEEEVCSGHGTCKDIDYCDCDCGWKGDQCETKIDIFNCTDEFCNSTKDCPITPVCNETAGCEPCQVPFCNTTKDCPQIPFCNETAGCKDCPFCNTTKDCPPIKTCPLIPNFNCSINCTCPEGPSCTKIPECFGINALNKSACSSNGKCLETDYCHCTYGYYGEECQYLNESLICPAIPFCNTTQDCPPIPFCNETAGCDPCQVPFCNTTKDCSPQPFCNETAGCKDCPFCNTTRDCPPPKTCPAIPYFNCSLNCTCPEGPVINCTKDCLPPTWDCFGIDKDDSEVCSLKGKCVSQDHCICAECWNYLNDCSMFDVNCTKCKDITALEIQEIIKDTINVDNLSLLIALLVIHGLIFLILLLTCCCCCVWFFYDQDQRKREEEEEEEEEEEK